MDIITENNSLIVGLVAYALAIRASEYPDAQALARTTLVHVDEQVREWPNESN